MRKGSMKRGISCLLSAVMILTLPGTDAFGSALTAGEPEMVEQGVVDSTGLVIINSPVVNKDNSVTFTLNGNSEYKNAKEVYLRGTIVNDWDTGKKMERNADGNFEITISGLEPGGYQYKFVVDGTWINDPLNNKYESGNSLVEVPGMIISGDNPAGVGSFAFTAADTMYEDAVVTEWKVLDAAGENEVPGMSISGDAGSAVLTTTDEALDGYFYVQVVYTENGVEGKTAKKKFYYTNRALIYQYTYKEGSAYTGISDIYTWYNSDTQNVGYKFKEVNGIYQANVNVDKETTSFGYIVRLPGMWGASESEDREYTDRSVALHEGEKYTKVRGGEGIEVPYVVPSGKSYYDNGIVFSYRDDALFYSNQMDTLEGKVKVYVKTPEEEEYTAYEMEYNAQEERFLYAMQNTDAVTLTPGEYAYYFEVDGVNTADQYNSSLPADASVPEARQMTYEKPELALTAETTRAEGVTCDQNAVIKVTAKDKASGEEIELKKITADLTNLGYDGVSVDFQADEKKGTVYISQKIAPGTYTVPVTVQDSWGNSTTTDAQVKVIAKESADSDWNEARIYFLLTDRFYDGNSSNNGAGYDLSMPESYHGGDFKGITEKLSYLQQLGINTIWISPIVDNIDWVMDEAANQYAYHGYWTQDFTKLDEHFGTNEEFDELLDEAHKRGIKVMVDIVVNHAGYKTENIFGNMLRSDSELGSDSITSRLSDLPDFRTEDPEVRAQLVAWQTAWAAYTTANGNSIDYFRVDTVKHVEHATWQSLKTSLAEVNPSFKMIGEYYGASYGNTGDYLGNGGMDALLDFDFKSYASNFVNGNNISGLEATLETRNSAIDNSLTLGQFLGSHDEDGFLTSDAIGGNTGKLKVAASLQITAKGQPIVYYGEEVNLSGPNAYNTAGNNRYDMQFENLDGDQLKTLAHYQKMLKIRSMFSDVFANGARTNVSNSDETADTSDSYLVFKRSTDSETVYVGLNNKEEAQSVTFEVGTAYESWTDVYSGTSYPVVEGQVTVSIPAAAEGGTIVLAQVPEVTGISITEPYQTSYVYGTSTDINGLTVTAHYSNGESAAVAESDYQVSGFDTSRTGSRQVTVSAYGFSESFTVQVEEISAASVKLNQETLTLEKGKTAALTATVLPANTTNPAVSWSTSDSKIASVSSTGVVTAVAKGTATITAKTANGKTASCTVTVKVPAASVALNTKSVTVTKGKTYTLKATVNPVDTTDGKLTWTSSKTSVATVNGSGKVTAKKAGTTVITVKTANGKTATCKVTVKVPAKSVTISSRIYLVKGKTKTLYATLLPADTTDKVTWTSSSKKVVSVKNGKIKGLKTGTAKITAKTTSGKKAVCRVTVVAKAKKAQKVTLNKKKLTIKKGNTAFLKATMSPAKSTDSLTWKSSNSKVAKVDKNGMITAVKKGTATITVNTTSKKKATCKITVK